MVELGTELRVFAGIMYRIRIIQNGGLGIEFGEFTGN